MSVASESLMAQLADQLPGKLDGLRAEYDVPGVAVGVLVSGLQCLVSSGVADVDSREPVTNDTLFFIGSTTKTMTATALMSLVDQGLVDLADRVVDHLPELRLSDEAACGRLRVGHLLNHTAGWQGDATIPVRDDADALAASLDVVATLDQWVQPGDVVSYNNMALLVAGRLIERLTGRSYEDVVTERVLAPLGMHDTVFHPWQVGDRQVAHGHVVRDGTLGSVPLPDYRRGNNPAGGAMSSVADLVRYAAYHLDARCDGQAPIRDTTRLLMQRPTVTCRSRFDAIGITWMLVRRDGLQHVQHPGSIANVYLTTFTLLPEFDLGLTVLTNAAGGAGLAEELTRWLTEDLLLASRAPAPDPLPLPATVAQELAGRYHLGQWDLVVSVGRDGRTLSAATELTDIPADVAESFAVPPAVEAVLVERDLLALEQDTRRTVADFIRDESGTVRWIRWGLRMGRRDTRWEEA